MTLLVCFGGASGLGSGDTCPEAVEQGGDSGWSGGRRRGRYGRYGRCGGEGPGRGQQAAGQDEECGQAAARGVEEVDLRALTEAVGEPADDEVAEEAGGRGEEGVLAGTGEAGARTFLVGLGHADAVVDDCEAVRGVLRVVPAVHLDPFGRRREGQPVLQEFGKEVGDIRDGVSAYPNRLHCRDQDPPVLLHLGDGGLDDFQSVCGLRRGPRRVLPRQDQQAFGVSPHAGGEVVEFEEFSERVRVQFLPFQAGDEAELTTYEILVAAAEVGERLGGVAAQARLLGGQVEGGVFHLAQGFRDFGDLRRTAQWLGLGVVRDMVLRGLLDTGDGRGQPVSCYVVGVLDERTERAGEGTRGEGGEGRDQGGHERSRQEVGGEAQFGVMTEAVGPVPYVVTDRLLDGVQVVHEYGHRVPPGAGVGAECGAVCGGFGPALVGGGAFGVLGGERVLQRGELGWGGDLPEAGEGGDAGGAHLGEGEVLAVVEGAVGEHAVEEAAFEGDGLLGGGQFPQRRQAVP